MGLFVGSVSLVTGFKKLLPKWMVWIGLAIAVSGAISWFSMLSLNGFLLFIPFTRFPALAWIIAVGFALPKVRSGSRT
jgi:hypothetical protein